MHLFFSQLARRFCCVLSFCLDKLVLALRRAFNYFVSLSKLFVRREKFFNCWNCKVLYSHFSVRVLYCITLLARYSYATRETETALILAKTTVGTLFLVNVPQCFNPSICSLPSYTLKLANIPDCKSDFISSTFMRNNSFYKSHSAIGSRSTLF